jgi:hypothetical protein
MNVGFIKYVFFKLSIPAVRFPMTAVSTMLVWL